MKLEFSRQIFKKLECRFIKIRLVEAELFHADGQTDMTKLIVALRNFSNAPKIRYKSFCVVKFDRSVLELD
jgi:hypothetical protein